MNLSGDRKLMEELGAIMLDPIKDGKLLSPPLKCSNLWKDKTAVIFAIRRPGCYLCREEGLALTKLERSGKLKNCVLFGVIKEVEEGSNDLQGIQSFQKKYFPYPIYRDELQQFYGTLGYGNWISLLPGNPLTLVTSVAKIAWRIYCKDIDGSMYGPGDLILGGVYIITPKRGVVFTYRENTGAELPTHDIVATLTLLREEEKKDSEDFTKQ